LAKLIRPSDKLQGNVSDEKKGIYSKEALKSSFWLPPSRPFDSLKSSPYKKFSQVQALQFKLYKV